jgi:hypothetical protein
MLNLRVLADTPFLPISLMGKTPLTTLLHMSAIVAWILIAMQTERDRS